jgi:hypothetical protein
VGFERIDVHWDPHAPRASWDDPWQPDARLRLARATLTRHQTLASEWSLCRLDALGSAARVFVFPTPAIEQPPASLWIANLREAALACGFCLGSDLWTEVVRSGWAGYDFNRIQDRTFSVSGGALDAGSCDSWQEYARSRALAEPLLCALPWQGLASMWGGFAHQRVLAARETDIFERHIPPVLSPSDAPKRRRNIKKA